MLNGIIYSLKFTVCALVLISCGAEPKDDGGFITSFGGEEIVADTTIEVVDYNIMDQPYAVYMFYMLNPEQIGTDYCYDEEAVKNLLMGDGTDEYTWVNSIVKENYLLFENQECYVTTEFVIKGEGDNTWAILLQSSKNGQQLDVFGWNEGGQEWFTIEYPKPYMTDFYHELADSDEDLVNEFGYYYMYIENEGQNISYVFSTWQMGLNADGKEIMDFNKEPDFSYDLMHDVEDGFWLKKIYENEALMPERYFLAYSETGEITDDFSNFSEMIGEQLEDYGVISSYQDFNAFGYEAYVGKDTFDFSAMEQFEPRNGYWFYERGKEPLDLEYDMVEPTVKKAKRYFDQKY